MGMASVPISIPTPSIPSGPDREFLKAHGYAVTCWFEGLPEKIAKFLKEMGFLIAGAAARAAAKILEFVERIKTFINTVVAAIKHVLNKVTAAIANAIAWANRIVAKVTLWVELQVHILMYRFMFCSVKKAAPKKMGV